MGDIRCDDTNTFVLNHGIYRGDVVNRNRSAASGGWAGTFGTFEPCASRFDQLIWSSTSDGSTNFGSSGDAQKSATRQQLMSPTTVSGGVYSYPDNKFLSTDWAAGSSTQHHALQNMPGGLAIQPRCVNVSGVPIAC